MSASYMNHVIDLLYHSKSLRATASGVARQTGVAAAGTAAGGLLLGPVGALVGGIVGAIVGYQMSDNYDCLVTSLRGLSDDEKNIVAGKVQQLVGGVSIEQFVNWISTDGHRQLLLTLLMEYMRGSMSGGPSTSSCPPPSAPPPYGNVYPRW